MSRRNVLRFRTFSKAYGLAGARVGYVIGHADVIKAFDKIRNHFGMAASFAGCGSGGVERSGLAQACGREVKAARERIYAIARANGLKPIPSATNFVAVDCGRDGAFARNDCGWAC